MSSAEDAARATFQRLGRYELLGAIASGGMATVHLGRAVGAKGFSRLVAIKKLHAHLEHDEEFHAMFMDEARLAARIRHPNVVGTLDVEDQAGLYIVMEYVEGDQLRALLRHASLKNEWIPRPIALRIALDALAGLHAAHELTDDEGKPLGLVHRDVSPHNILIGIEGGTKITDFGIAKAESRLSHTRDGELKGKLAYMAPEQTCGLPVDRRADVFAMGIVVWEMLTGKRLFKAENDAAVLNALLHAPVPTTRSADPELPEALDAAVMKALERLPENRFETALAFADALESASATVGGIASTRAVAAFVQEVAGPKIERERARLRAGLTLSARAESEHSSPSSVSHSSPASASSQIRALRRETSEDVTNTASEVARAESEPRRANLKQALLLLAVAAAGASVAAIAMSRRGPAPETHAARSAEPASPTTTRAGSTAGDGPGASNTALGATPAQSDAGAASAQPNAGATTPTTTTTTTTPATTRPAVRPVIRRPPPTPRNNDTPFVNPYLRGH